MMPSLLTTFVCVLRPVHCSVRRIPPSAFDREVEFSVEVRISYFCAIIDPYYASIRLAANQIKSEIGMLASLIINFAHCIILFTSRRPFSVKCNARVASPTYYREVNICVDDRVSLVQNYTQCRLSIKSAPQPVRKTNALPRCINPCVQ